MLHLLAEQPEVDAELDQRSLAVVQLDFRRLATARYLELLDEVSVPVELVALEPPPLVEELDGVGGGLLNQPRHDFFRRYSSLPEMLLNRSPNLKVS
jgi:hypothetical protein